jgi:Holliday junction DNA helicase RuvA
MIAYLKWEILDLELNKVIILTTWWVGYEVLINEMNFSKIQCNDKKTLELFIYHHRTENSQILFWFIDKEEKHIFEELIKVNWVGWKVALNILSIWLTRLVDAISSADNKTIESIKWIWKKWASKIILELKDSEIIKKFSNFSWKNKSENKTEQINISQKHQDVINTLVAMWYKKEDIEKTLANLPESISSINDIIPFVIKNI